VDIGDTMSNTDGYFTISELAKEFDVKKSHIRFCEGKGLIKPRVSIFNRRVYSTYDHARLKLILHCVLVGYSQEQIVDLIGMPDANLDPNAQVQQGIECAQKKIKELEHRRNEAKFHERTSIMTELNMMWEYIEAIKTIKLEEVEKPPAKPAIGVKDKEKTAPEPPKAVKTDIETKSERQPGRMIPVFAAGLGLLLITGGYFFYQSVQQKKTPVELAQKEKAQTGTHPVYHQPVPSDPTVDPAAASPATKETSGPPSPVQTESIKADSTPPVNVTSVTGETSSALEKQKVADTQIKPVPEAKGKETPVVEKTAVKKAPADDSLSAPAADTETQKAPDVEVKEPPEPESALIAASVADKISSAPEKQKISSPQIQPSSEDKAKVKAVEEKPAVKEELAAPAGEKLKTSAPETKTEKAPEVEIKETPKSEAAVGVAAATGEGSPTLKKQNVAATETQQTSEAQVQENIIAAKPVVEAASPAEADEKLSAVMSESDTAEASDVVSTKVANESSSKEAAASGAGSTASPDQEIETPQLAQTSEVKTEETVALEKSVESGSDPLAAAPEPEKASAPEADKETSATGAGSTASPEQEIETPQLGQTSEVKTEETVALGKAVESGSDPPAAAPEAKKEAAPEAEGKEPAVATGFLATSGKARETTSTPSVEVSSGSGDVSSAPETEMPPIDETKEASAEPDTEQALVSSKGGILEKEDSQDRLRAFLNTYCQAYESKDIDKFFTFFAPDASENNRPFHELMPTYRKNMETIDSFKYRIEIIAYSTQADTGNIRIQGKFFTQYLLHGGSWKDNSGSISMELVEHGDSFLVKQLNY
jgi:DNA-binding transcriptional MerR regulator